MNISDSIRVVDHGKMAPIFPIPYNAYMQRLPSRCEIHLSTCPPLESGCFVDCFGHYNVLDMMGSHS